MWQSQKKSMYKFTKEIYIKSLALKVDMYSEKYIGCSNRYRNIQCLRKNPFYHFIWKTDRESVWERKGDILNPVDHPINS